MDNFKSLINQLREIFPKLEDPNNLSTMDDCIKWFKDYKKEIKSINQEWQYCKENLKALDLWNSNLTKNQAYMKENSTIINNLYRYYVIPQGNQYNPSGMAPSLEEIAIEELGEGYREEDI